MLRKPSAAPSLRASSPTRASILPSAWCCFMPASYRVGTCSLGMIRKWTGACGRTSSNAHTSASSCTFFAGISPRTILQKMQLGSEFISFAPLFRPARKCPRAGAARRARRPARRGGAPARSSNGTTGPPPRARGAAGRRFSPRAPSRSPPRRSSSAWRRRRLRTAWRRRICRDRRPSSPRSSRRCAPASRTARVSCRLSLLVDELRILQHRIRFDPFPVLQFAEETAFVPRMAGDASHLLDPEQDGVGVAVDADLLHLLHVPGFLALAPQLVARAGEVDRLLLLDGPLQRLAFHPGDVEDLSRRRILGHDGHQLVLVPVYFVEPAHKRTSMPRLFMCSFASRTVKSPKWNTLAASTASARPSSTPSARCSFEPTPPEATTGTPTASDTARVSARSKPLRVPSRSMLVSRISPAPASCMRLAHSTASSPVGLRPPWVNTSHEPPFFFASMATTMAWLPTISEASRTSSGFCTAEVLIDTLSAPALSRRRTSSTLRTPPPTVSGMKTRLATASMT